MARNHHQNSCGYHPAVGSSSGPSSPLIPTQSQKPCEPMAFGPHELEHPLQIGRDAEQENGCDSPGHGCTQTRSLRPDDAVCKTEDRLCGHRRKERHCQVVGDVGGDSRQLRQRAHHPVAEVVVADRLAAQPRVLGRAGKRQYGGVQEREVHRLLGVVDGRVGGPVESPGYEEDQEDDLGQRDDPPLLLQEEKEIGAGASTPAIRRRRPTPAPWRPEKRGCSEPGGPGSVSRRRSQ